MLTLRRYLFDQARVPPNKVYMFNTFFHSSLTDTGRNYKAIINYDKVKGWTRDVDIFSYDYILVPVHESYVSWSESFTQH